MRRAGWLLFLLVVTSGRPSVLAQDKPDELVRRATVRVVSAQRPPNLLKPWLREQTLQNMGSGVVIDGERILTNAHLVMYASQIYVQPHQSSQTFPATVDGIGIGVDLAVLKVANKGFFKDRAPVKMAATLPEANAPVSVHGYVVGGTALSTTKAAVSRIEFEPVESVLRIELSGAVNPGGSGGPAVINGEMVGLAFGFSQEVQNVGYVIPNEEIMSFLHAVDREERTPGTPAVYRGQPRLWAHFQALENEALRAKLALAEDVTGVLVRDPMATAREFPLRKLDVITKIGDYSIGNTGMVRINDSLSLPFQYLVPKLERNGSVPVTVRRDGQEANVDVPVVVERNSVLPSLHGGPPSYFVYGPLVFSNATEELVQGAGPIVFTILSHRSSPLFTRRMDDVRFEGEELVVAVTALPHKSMQGYEDPTLQVASKVNGVPIRNLRHLAETLRDTTDEFIEIEFADRYTDTLVFNRKEMMAATEDILADNGIRQQCSPDLRGVWKSGN